MDVKAALNNLKNSKVFTKWRKYHKDTFFSYAFKIKEEMPNGDWQLGFYDKKSDTITTFVIEGGRVSIRPNEEIFKRDETDINKLDIEKVKLSFDAIVQNAVQFQQKNYPKDKSIKTIAILQNIQEFGDIWNLTFVTESFNTLNMKINASNGKIVEHRLSSILSLRQKE